MADSNSYEIQQHIGYYMISLNIASNFILKNYEFFRYWNFKFKLKHKSVICYIKKYLNIKNGINNHWRKKCM